jgi:hypothetical protein
MGKLPAAMKPMSTPALDRAGVMAQVIFPLIFTTKDTRGATNLGVLGVSPKVDFSTTWPA